MKTIITTRWRTRLRGRKRESGDSTRGIGLAGSRRNGGREKEGLASSQPAEKARNKSSKKVRDAGKDIYHDLVHRLLVAEGWRVTHDPYRIVVGRRNLFVDL